jgi:NAD-dependent histone deacetylase SIR2
MESILLEANGSGDHMEWSFSPCTTTTDSICENLQHTNLHGFTTINTYTILGDNSPDEKTNDKSSQSSSTEDDSTSKVKKTKQKKSSSGLRKPKLPKRSKPIGTVLDLSCLKTLDSYCKELLKTSQVCRDDLALLHHVFKHSRRLVVITGAGISVHAGIPDFRSSTGLFKILKNDYRLKTSGKQMFDASIVYNDSTQTKNFHSTMSDLHSLCTSSSSTPFHEFINEISGNNRLLRLYTQNIDCLDTSLSHLSTRDLRAASEDEEEWPKTVQLHGSIKYMNCSKCQWTSEFEPSLFTRSESVPECPECIKVDSARVDSGKRSIGIGRLRPKVVLYNEFNPDAEVIGQITESDLTSRPDGLIVVGTSLKIPGVRRMVREMSQAVHASKGTTIWMNIDDPPQITKREFEGCFDLIVKGDCQIIPELLNDYEQEVEDLERQKLFDKRVKEEQKLNEKKAKKEQKLHEKRLKEEQRLNHRKVKEEAKLQRIREREENKKKKLELKIERSLKKSESKNMNKKDGKVKKKKDSAGTSAGGTLAVGSGVKAKQKSLGTRVKVTNFEASAKATRVQHHLTSLNTDIKKENELLMGMSSSASSSSEETSDFSREPSPQLVALVGRVSNDGILLPSEKKFGPPRELYNYERFGFGKNSILLSDPEEI